MAARHSPYLVARGIDARRAETMGSARESPVPQGRARFQYLMMSTILLLEVLSMHYAMPNFPCEFKIPDAWLGEAGIDGFTRTSSAYRSSAEAAIVPLSTIEPPYRSPSHPKDWRGFDRERLISILRGIAAGIEIEPVPLWELPAGTFVVPAPYRYRVNNGFHRYYASIVVGFECLPGAIV